MQIRFALVAINLLMFTFVVPHIDLSKSGT